MLACVCGFVAVLVVVCGLVCIFLVTTVCRFVECVCCLAVLCVCVRRDDFSVCVGIGCMWLLFVYYECVCACGTCVGVHV